MRQKTNLLLSVIFCFAILFLLVGCSKSKEVPDPPCVKTTLILELCSALKNKNYQLTLKKVDRLKVIEPYNSSLVTLYNWLQNNILILDIQQLLRQGRLEEAVKLVNDAMKQRGRNLFLLDTLSELNKLKRIKELTDKILEAKNSRELAVNSAKLNKAIGLYPIAGPLKVFVNRKLNVVRGKLAFEKALGIEDLKADIDTAWVKCEPCLGTMMASLDAEKPNDIDVQNYRRAMSRNWMDESLANLYDDGKGVIFFRKALLLGNSERKEIYSALLLLPPNNFRGLLIKALLLKFAGYSKNSDYLASQLASELSLPADFYKRWYRLAFISIIDSKTINPFVLYPFLIYYFEPMNFKSNKKKE